jgi:putative transcriptional regulator
LGRIGEVDMVKYEITPKRIKYLRNSIGISQVSFSHILNIGLGTLRHWERGDRKPSGAALTLLCLLESNPESILPLISQNN